MSFWEDVFGSGPQFENGRHKRLPVPDNQYVNAIIVSSINKERLVARGSTAVTYDVTEEMKEKIKSHLISVESLFSDKCGKKLTIRPVWGPVTTGNPDKAVIDAETLESDYTEQMKSIFNHNKTYFPEIELVILYAKGDALKSGVSGRSWYRKFEEESYYHSFIIMSESATEKVLAHELGHILNFTNKDGAKNDPDPMENEPEHNKNPGNLMHKEVTTTDITEEQCKQFFESKIIQ
ncbi:hypothetical protein [Robertmurraya sp. FSL R5-0851]|uniref:hypothetical protein n=1 Tax=Robertmurraya sp. FSL R5-0851 TaxID=2921584 RepID=UPI0030F574E1